VRWCGGAAKREKFCKGHEELREKNIFLPKISYYIYQWRDTR
jgi:hypothetical protein